MPTPQEQELTTLLKYREELRSNVINRAQNFAARLSDRRTLWRTYYDNQYMAEKYVSQDMDELSVAVDELNDIERKIQTQTTKTG